MNLKKIMDRAKSIGLKKRERVAITPVFDNAIDALKEKLEKRYWAEKILNEKRRATELNEYKRDRVILMEEKIKERIKQINKEREERIKAEQQAEFKDVRRKLAQRNNRVKELESIESELIRRLEHSKNVHFQEVAAIQPYMDALDLKGLGKTVDDRKGQVLYLGGRNGQEYSDAGSGGSYKKKDYHSFIQ